MKNSHIIMCTDLYLSSFMACFLNSESLCVKIMVNLVVVLQEVITSLKSSIILISIKRSCKVEILEVGN